VHTSCVQRGLDVVSHPIAPQSAMESLGYKDKNKMVYQMIENIKGEQIDFEQFLDMMTAKIVRCVCACVCVRIAASFAFCVVARLRTVRLVVSELLRLFAEILCRSRTCDVAERHRLS